ncbi:hypothetical protein GGTG_00331 [Gaeumannomyces tritici R3-111a-1]|uniref:Uncharacterized protein n=1 Tax=Gaeumannomyces tritici (strain R3-111a-1) TaxID=644352 RepID=J3NGE0_GAET3|nr:hypothetical protein GGTG_00331 [Gaeumannomyces tritici R3-111a-1]EJT80330.1 hypothetical protein GGTG_00331 [Gaeumannomyces tritici R3-111a-1]
MGDTGIAGEVAADAVWPKEQATSSGAPLSGAPMACICDLAWFNVMAGDSSHL